MEIYTHCEVNYPIKIELIVDYTEGTNTRSRNLGLLKEEKVTVKSQRSYTNDAIHIWNQAPNSIKDCVSIYSAKKAIKAFVALLPI